MRWCARWEQLQCMYPAALSSRLHMALSSARGLCSSSCATVSIRPVPVPRLAARPAPAHACICNIQNIPGCASLSAPPGPGIALTSSHMLRSQALASGLCPLLGWPPGLQTCTQPVAVLASPNPRSLNYRFTRPCLPESEYAGKAVASLVSRVGGSTGCTRQRRRHAGPGSARA